MVSLHRPHLAQLVQLVQHLIHPLLEDYLQVHGSTIHCVTLFLKLTFHAVDSFKTTQPQTSTFSPLSPTNHHHQSHSSISSSITTAPPSQSPSVEKDPYAALRSLSISSASKEEPPKQEMIPDGVHERQDSEDTAWTGKEKGHMM